MGIKTFLSGEYTQQVFHALGDYSGKMQKILGEGFDIARNTDHYEAFESWDYQPFDLLVFYTDQWWIKAWTQVQLGQALLHYVAMGGGLVLIHQMDAGSDYELGQMLGVRPTTPLWLSNQEGPEMRLRFEPVAGHPITEGVGPFTLTENMFDIEYDNLTQKDVALNAKLDNGLSLPMAWTTQFGLGKIVCLLPGHTEEAFDDPNFARLIRNSAVWAARKEVRK